MKNILAYSIFGFLLFGCFLCYGNERIIHGIDSDTMARLEIDVASLPIKEIQEVTMVGEEYHLVTGVAEIINMQSPDEDRSDAVEEAQHNAKAKLGKWLLRISSKEQNVRFQARFRGVLSLCEWQVSDRPEHMLVTLLVPVDGVELIEVPPDTMTPTSAPPTPTITASNTPAADTRETTPGAPKPAKPKVTAASVDVERLVYDSTRQQEICREIHGLLDAFETAAAERQLDELRAHRADLKEFDALERETALRADYQHEHHVDAGKKLLKWLLDKEDYARAADFGEIFIVQQEKARSLMSFVDHEALYLAGKSMDLAGREERAAELYTALIRHNPTSRFITDDIKAKARKGKIRLK